MDCREEEKEEEEKEEREGEEGSSQESGRGEMEKVEGDERKWTTVGWERKMIGERERDDGVWEGRGFEMKGRQFKLVEC